MFRQALRWTHLASVGTYVGALLMLLVLGSVAEPISPLSFAATRQAMSIAANEVLVPALLLALTSGFLLVVARPQLIDARWVWAKAALGLVIGGLAFLAVQPASNRATGLALQGAMGASVSAVSARAAGGRATLDDALATERRGRWLNLGLASLAIVIAVWRPRLRRMPPAAPKSAPASVDAATPPRA